MIQRSLRVRVSPSRAFRAWTQSVDLWWPRNHRISGVAKSTMVIEEGVGGRFYERTPEGREIPYGKVVCWQPPERLDYDFYLGSDKDSPTRVEVRFNPADEGTRVDILHHRGGLSEERWAANNEGYGRAWNHLAQVIVDFMEKT